MEQVLIIGGGIGGAIAHDLSLRGFAVTLLEKGELLCGATGRHHGLLHSGARHALHDIATARECMQENRILRRIVPVALEQNDALFIALNDADLAWKQPFLDACRTAGIAVEEISAARALQLEPRLTPDLKAAVRVPDAVKSGEILALTGRDGGEPRCRRHLSCSRVCPTGVYPARHIAELRKYRQDTTTR